MHPPRLLQDLELPVIQAPMAGVQDEALALAVSATGALGSIPCAMLDLVQLGRLMDRLALQALPVNLNFFCHPMPRPDAVVEQRWRDVLAPYYRELGIHPAEPSSAAVRRPIDETVVDLLAQYRPGILSFHFGLPPARLVQRIKAWGATILASATTLEEARWLERNGADIVIAQGIEAGGHRGHFLSDNLALQPSTSELVETCVAQLAVPIIAAGGVGGPHDVQALLAAGAAAVQAGTAYLLCPQARTPQVHRNALQREALDTALTNLFSGRPARGIVNRLMRELGPLSPIPPAFPWASQALMPLRAAAEAAGRDDFTPLWSGTAACRYPDVDAATITRHLAGSCSQADLPDRP